MPECVRHSCGSPRMLESCPWWSFETTIYNFFRGAIMQTRKIGVYVRVSEAIVRIWNGYLKSFPRLWDEIAGRIDRDRRLLPRLPLFRRENDFRHRSTSSLRQCVNKDRHQRRAISLDNSGKPEFLTKDTMCVFALSFDIGFLYTWWRIVLFYSYLFITNNLREDAHEMHFLLQWRQIEWWWTRWWLVFASSAAETAHER